MYTRLSALDANFLEIESPITPMHVGALSRFEGAPLRDATGRFRLEEVRELVAERIALVPRFRQRLLDVPFGVGRPVWVDDPTFDVAYHVNLTTLPSPGTPEQLRHLTEHLQMQLLDRSRPLWELWFVDGLADGTIAEIEKIHHALVDGVASVDVGMALCDTTPIPRRVQSATWQPSPPPSRAALFLDSVVAQLAGPALAMLAFGDAASHPQATFARMRRLAGAASTLVRRQTVAPHSSLNQTVSRTRILESVHLSLPEVRETRRALGGTVNDVVLAVVAGGLRHYLQARRDTIPDRPYRVLVPVSTRSDDEHVELGNRVAAIMAPLPVGEPDPLERLRAVREAMGELKEHGQAQVTGALLAGTDRLPSAVAGPVGRLVHHQPFINLVVTNVPGPQQPLYLAGARLLESIPIVPLGGNLDVSVGVFSYDGQLTIGLFADGASCPDIAIFAEGIDKSFVELRHLADQRRQAEEVS
jgi:WS/DGAT/MGAT family acyltransferase